MLGLVLWFIFLLDLLFLTNCIASLLRVVGHDIINEY